MEKWNEPKGSPPKWLDLADEVTTDEPKLPRDQFVVACMEACLRLDCDPMQAAGVTANVLNESAWGQSYRAFNFGGWKIYEHYAITYRKVHGKGPRWWRAPGNKAPGATLKDLKGGDPPWCFYRAFDSIKDFLGHWLQHFVPRPDYAAPYSGYRRCGKVFWAGDEWFPWLISAGYKGENTRKHPESAIVEHRQLVEAAITRWAQARLGGLVIDGVWGPKSRQICFVWQQTHGLEPTGVLDDATFRALAAQ